MSEEKFNDKAKFTILFKDGTEAEIEIEPNFQTWPVAVIYRAGDAAGNYPIWDGHSHNNLYGRIMTLVDAIIENSERKKAVKNLFSKEMQDFSHKMHQKAKYYRKSENTASSLADPAMEL